VTLNFNWPIFSLNTSVANKEVIHYICVTGAQLKTGFLPQQEQVAAQPSSSASQSPRHEDQSHKAPGQQTEGGSTLAPPPPYPGPPPPYPGAVQVRLDI
jgi:hypothetical protein